DFEEGQDFLFAHLNRLPRPRLLALLGNTLGNLDVGAEHFLRQIAGRMQSGDHLLLDVATVTERWDLDLDTYFRSAIRRRFVAQGIARQLGQNIDAILRRFKHRIASRRTETRRRKLAEQHVIYDKETDKVALTIRAFYFKKFCNWIEKEVPSVRV